MNRTLLAIALTLACAAIATLAAAQVYRWVDKDGKVHYSDHKPPDAPAKDLHIDSAASDPEAAEKAMAELKAQNEGLAASDEARRQATDQAKEAQEVKAKRCAKAQADLKLLESVRLTYVTDAQGKRTYDDDKQNQARKDEARRKVAESCE